MLPELKISLNENDYLKYQLFTASQSSNIRKRRLRNKFLVPLIFILLGVFPRFDFTELFTQGYLLIAVLWFFLYPIWERRFYINHYKKHIAENYKNNFGKVSEIIFRDNHFDTKDEDSKTEILNTNVEEINEVPEAFYIKLKSGQSLIIPKNKVDNITELKDYFQSFTVKYSIKYNDFQNWKWK